MLAWSYRKLGDIGKLSGDPAGAQADYRKAIAVGRESLTKHLADRETMTHLATALNDLAGVLHDRRDLREAGPLFAEAETLYTGLLAKDPENASTRFMLVHAQVDHARCLRDLARFPEAAAAFRRALDSLKRIPNERLSSHPMNDYLQRELLARELADCDASAAVRKAGDAPPATP